MRMGAETFVDFKKVDNTTEAVVAAANGIGAHGVFVTAPSAYNTAISYIGKRVNAKVMCIGLRRSTPFPPSFSGSQLITAVQLPQER